MSLEETLARVRADIESGNLGKARDRLHGLISNRPSDFLLREDLGEVYWDLGDPAMAGRWWYFAEEPTPQMREAIAAFESRHGGEPGAVLRALKVHFPPPTPYVTARLLDLESRARKAGTFREPRKRQDARRSSSRVASALLQYGCMTLIALVAVLAIVGFVTVLKSFR